MTVVQTVNDDSSQEVKMTLNDDSGQDDSGQDGSGQDDSILTTVVRTTVS